MPGASQAAPRGRPRGSARSAAASATASAPAHDASVPPPAGAAAHDAAPARVTLPELVSARSTLARARALLREERHADPSVRNELLAQAGSAVLAVATLMSDLVGSNPDGPEADRWTVVRAEPKLRELAAVLLDQNLVGLLDQLGHEPPPSAQTLADDLQNALAEALVNEDGAPDSTMRALRESLVVLIWKVEEHTDELQDALPDDERKARRALRATVRAGAKALLPLLVSAAGAILVTAMVPPAGAAAGVVAAYAGTKSLTTGAFSLAGGQLATKLLAPVTASATVDEVRQARLAEIARNARAVTVLVTETALGTYDDEFAAALVSSLRISLHLYLATGPTAAVAKAAGTMLEVLSRVTDPDDQSVLVDQLPHYAPAISGLADFFAQEARGWA